MRKFLTLIITAGLVLSMTVPALAESKKEEIAVRAERSNEPVLVHTMSIGISWGELDFTYEEVETKTWNPSTKKYDSTSTTGKFNKTEESITVTNRSDVPVDVEISYSGDYGSISDEEGTIEACEEHGEPGTHTATFFLDEEIQNKDKLAAYISSAGNSIGTITVKVTGDTSST